MTRDDVINGYFEWMYNSVSSGRHTKGSSYRKLFMLLHRTEFIFSIPRDENRAMDGLDLRRRFAQDADRRGYILDCLRGPCSVLEMMIALAKKAEDDIMHDPDYGDRTGRWFWVMLENLGLDICDDLNYNEGFVNHVLDVFMHHRYAPNGGAGGMFSIRKCCRDLRKTDLWWQLNAYFEENYPVPIW